MTMDFASSSDVGAGDVSTTETKRDSKTIDARAFNVVTDPSRDALLTDFGKTTLEDRYLLQGESSVNCLADLIDASPSTVSQHLAKLRLAGLVNVRRAGTYAYYVAANSHVQRLLDEALSHADHAAHRVDSTSTHRHRTRT